MRFKQIIIDLFTRLMAIGRNKKPFLLPAAAILFVLAALMSRRGGSKEVWFAIMLPGILLLLFLCLVLLVLYISQSKKILQKKLSFTFGRAALIVFLGIMLAVYLVKSFSFNKGLSDYIISSALDTTSYFTQAKIFAEGHLSVPSHTLKEFFQTGFCINDGKFFGMYPPGWPLILSFGILLKLPWMINPLLTCVTLYIIYLLGNKLYDRETAWIAVLFTGFSPMVLWGASSYFSEPVCLLFSTLFFYAAIQTLEVPKRVFPVLAGACLGIVFLIRPYSAVALAFPMVIYWLIKLRQQPKRIWRGILLIVAFLPLFFLHLVYNYYQTDSPWLLPMSYYNPLNKPGFGLRSGDTVLTPFYFGPLSALINLGVGVVNINWIGLPLVILFVFFALIGYRRKWDLLLCCTAISMIVFHCVYFAVNRGRFYYPAFFAIFLLSARGVINFERFMKERLRIPSFGSFKTFSVLFPIVCSLLLISMPEYINGVRSQTRLLDPFLQIHDQKISDAIVFLKTVPEAYNNIGYYIQNSPNFDDPVLFVNDLGERNTQLMEFYPDRTYYRYEFDRREKKGILTRINSPL